jgi:hypothetical protein
MESGTKSKRPLGITILMIWFVLEGIFYFYTNSIDGIFGSQKLWGMFGGSIVENTLVAYGLIIALFYFVIVWGFMERKYWIRITAIISFIITTSITGILTFFGYATLFEIIFSASLDSIVIIYLMKSNVKKYFDQSSSHSLTPV